MADPTGYARSYSFTNWQASKPKTPLPAHEVDNEFDNVAQAMSETQDALADIRRSDGALKNGIVTFDALTDDVSDLLSILPEIDAKADEAIAAAAAAAQSQALADAARIQAELAATVAGAPIYPNTTAGLAGTANGGMFFTPQGGGGFRVWQNVSGTAVHAGYIGANGAINPMEFAAVGNGTADDSAALNLAFAALRVVVNGSFWIGAPAFLDFQHKTYKVVASGVDATEISGVSWGWGNGRIIGACAGKAVLDTTGSRGYHFHDFNIWGDYTDTPSVGWQAARSTGGGHFGFCDLNLVERVHIAGEFSVAPQQLYGQESTTYIECEFMQHGPSGQAGIIGGYDTTPIASDYATPVTGGRSNIDIRFIGCRWRYLPPASEQAVTTNITAANPAVLTFDDSNGFAPANGDAVCLSALTSMTSLNSLRGTVQNATGTTFEIAGLDTSALGSFSGSGYVTRAQTAATLKLHRLSNASFTGCYIQAFGQPAIGFSWPDTSVPHGLDFNGLLVEGAPSSYIHFTQGSTDKSIAGFRFSTPENLAGVAVFTLDAGSAGKVSLGNGWIFVDHDPYGTRKVILDAQVGKFSLPGMKAFAPTIGAINYLGLATARGEFYGYDSTTVRHVGSYLHKPAAYNPTFTYDLGSAWTVVAADGELRPLTNLTFNIGSASYRAAGVYTGLLNASGAVTMSGAVSMTNLPTSDPGVSGRLWRDPSTNVVKVSP